MVMESKKDTHVVEYRRIFRSIPELTNWQLTLHKNQKPQLYKLVEKKNRMSMKITFRYFCSNSYIVKFWQAY